MSLLSPVPSEGNVCAVLLRAFWLLKISNKTWLMSSLHIGNLECEEHNGWWKIMYSSYIMSVSYRRAKR